MDCRSPSTGVNLGAKGGGGEGEERRAACERKVERGGNGLNFANIKWSLREKSKEEEWERHYSGK